MQSLCFYDANCDEEIHTGDELRTLNKFISLQTNSQNFSMYVHSYYDATLHTIVSCKNKENIET